MTLIHSKKAEFLTLTGSTGTVDKVQLHSSSKKFKNFCYRGA